MARHRIVAAIGTLIGLGLMAAISAQAQDAPTPEEIAEAWLASPHALADAEAFTHWDEEGEVPGECAVCHSGTGFVAYLEGEGTAPGVLSHPVPTGSVVNCETCHAEPVEGLSAVTFPSGETVEGLGGSATCAVCHQGRLSTDAVEEAVAGLDPDAVSSDLSFLNIHYRAAAATLYGAAVRGGYQYDGQSYAGRFAHPAPFDTCTGCHDPHATEVAVESCTACHDAAEPTAIRARESDVDGDGDAAEGVAQEVATLHERLLGAIAAYAGEVANTPIAYAPDQYPYFFVDTDGDGVATATEATFPNRFNAWTPRLLRAAYNYQFVAKDPGAYAHNPTYSMQLLVDSLTDLAEEVEVDTADVARP